MPCVFLTVDKKVPDWASRESVIGDAAPTVAKQSVLKGSDWGKSHLRLQECQDARHDIGSREQSEPLAFDASMTNTVGFGTASPLDQACWSSAFDPMGHALPKADALWPDVPLSVSSLSDSEWLGTHNLDTPGLLFGAPAWAAAAPNSGIIDDHYTDLWSASSVCGNNFQQSEGQTWSNQREVTDWAYTQPCQSSDRGHLS